MSRVAVVGIGAMGGGIAHALLTSSVTKEVIGYDKSDDLVDAFYEDSNAVGKAASSPPKNLSAVVGCDFIFLVLVNQSQCQQVCFGGEDSGDVNLLNMLPESTCVILCSTVTATWAKGASDKFKTKNISFVDCPVSGGPVRAKVGDLTLMASGDDASLKTAKPLLQAMGKIHVIQGGPGMGSTVKMVHQLLAGVHICCAAEALALAAKAGLDVEQMYNIVNGAAGASWMFEDRGKRMLDKNPDVKSALNIFIKDMDIVYNEAKALGSPIPLASACLQQFIAGQQLGYGRQDDSQVVKVYEGITKTPVSKSKQESKERNEGSQVGDIWKMRDGSEEEILEAGDEPRHQVVISNEYVRALRVNFPPKDTTWAHRHAEDSLYFFLVEGGLDVVNHIQGSDPACDCMEFGEVRYGTHKSDKPLVHKITNMSETMMLCVDAEVLKQPPIVAAIPLVAEHHELIKSRPKCRVYKFTLSPGECVTVNYPFFYFLVVLRSSTIKTELGGGGGGGNACRMSWEETPLIGDVHWKEPTIGLKQSNVGASLYEAYIAEWR